MGPLAGKCIQLIWINFLTWISFCLGAGHMLPNSLSVCLNWTRKAQRQWLWTQSHWLMAKLGRRFTTAANSQVYCVASEPLQREKRPKRLHWTPFCAFWIKSHKFCFLSGALRQRDLKNPARTPTTLPQQNPLLRHLPRQPFQVQGACSFLSR